MRYAIANVVREDGVVGTLILKVDLRSESLGMIDRNVKGVDFRPDSADAWEPKRVRRDVETGKTVGTVSAEDLRGVDEATRKALFP